MAISYTPEQNTYKEITPFRRFVLQSFPWINETFDSLTNYELMGKIIEYLNDIISNENAVQSNVTALYNAFVNLQNYVNNYFDNLDVQDEINSKLDSMAQDGSLTTLIGEYVTPYIDAQNRRITNVENELSSVASGSPAGVYATVSALTTADPDHSKIYVVSADGNWYYYNGTTWASGGTYQSTVVENFSIPYQKLLPFKNGAQAVTWIDGYIASANNTQHNEGDIDPNAYSNGYKRTNPIALTKGMTLIYKTCALGNINALSKVNSSNQFISTILAGTETAGNRVRVYQCQEAYEFVCIGNITQYNSTPEIYIYDSDFDLKDIVERSHPDITTQLNKGFLSDVTSTYGANILVLSSSASTSGRRFSDFIKVRKGQILFTNAAENGTNVDIIGLFNEDFTYNKTILRGYANSQHNNNHYYIVESDGYVVIGNDVSLVSASNLVIKLFDSFDEIYNINGFQKISPIWKNYYMNATTGAITPTSNSYQTTEKIPLKKGDVIYGITASTTDNAPKIAVSDGIAYEDLIIINNNANTSEYYDPSYAFNYVATKNCFVEILNKIDTISQANTEIFVNPMATSVSNVYGKKFCAIGDSYIKNQNDNCGYTWMSRFANKYGAKYYMRGIGGTGLVIDNSYGESALNRLDTIPLDSDFILIVGGKNDYNDQTSMQTFKDGIASIIATIQTNHPTAKMMFATPWNTYGTSDPATIKLKDYAAAIVEICEKYSVPVFDSFTKSNMYLYDETFRTNYAQSSSDGSHLNINGHKRMLERIETFLKSI